MDFLILLTSMIHFYFTIINLIIFNMLKIFFFNQKRNIFKEILQGNSTLSFFANIVNVHCRIL